MDGRNRCSKCCVEKDSCFFFADEVKEIINADKRFSSIDDVLEEARIWKEKKNIVFFFGTFRWDFGVNIMEIYQVVSIIGG